MTRSEWFGLLILLCAAAVCAFALSGCQKEGDTHVAIPALPTVEIPALCPDDKTPCFHAGGNGPMKCLPTRTLSEKDNVCFRGGTCLYGCHE